MKIKVINPNTTASMTEKIGVAAQSVVNPGTELLALEIRGYLQPVN
jgi:allantoin racemase